MTEDWAMEERELVLPTLMCMQVVRLVQPLQKRKQ